MSTQPKEKLRLMTKEDFDEETNAIAVVMAVMRRLTFDQQWRVMNYVLVRMWGRTWLLARPQGDVK